MTDQTLLGLELSTELLNERLEGYRVLREVGHGAMGIVFEARQRGLDRRVAVKVLPPNLSMRDRTVRRFLREAEAMGRLAHTNIVDVYEVGSVGSLHYFAMRFVDGPPLDIVLKTGVLGIGDVIQVGIDVSSALAHAHSRGVMHRDVKPSNLLRDGERVVLTDFGLAKPIDSDDEDAMTESGDLVGTPLYMSPEQIIGDSSGIDARSDVWGLGATLYELLIGRPPFSGGSAQSILHAILHRDPALLRRQRADVPRDLEAVLLKCLEKDRTRRYSGAAGLHADLLALQGGASVSARPPRFVDPALRWSRRHPYQTAAMVIALGVFVGFTVNAHSAQQTQQKTESERKVAAAQRDSAREEKMLALAQSELLSAIVAWGDSEGKGDIEKAGIRLRALDTVGHLMQAIKIEEYPQISAEIMRVYASFAVKAGVDESTLTALYPASAEATPVTLMMRGAMLDGLKHFDEALSVHQQRAKVSPRAPEPLLDAGNTLRQMALMSRVAGDEVMARRRFAQAIAMHGQALGRAVRSGDENATATVLIERARCLIAIGDRVRAKKNLDDALGHDRARADALALLEACKEEPGVNLPSTDPGLAQTPVAQASQTPIESSGGKRPSPLATNEPAPASKGLLGLPLVNRLPTALDLDKKDLTDAGKNLASIYRGLRDVLRTAESAVPSTAPPSGKTPASGTEQQQ